MEETKIQNLNYELYGKEEYSKMHWMRTFRDIRSYLYLLSRFKLKKLYNFWYTKTLLPTGEGSHLALLSRFLKHPDAVPLPRIFEMETTTVCNKRCVICEYIYWPKGEQVRRHMRLEEFKHIADQFPVVNWINLTGEGSAFLNKDYPKMLEYLWKKHRTSIWLVDHLDDMSIDTLKKQVFPYVDGIYVSMDAATKQTYELIKKGCDFDNVISNLKDIIQYKRTKKTPFPHLQFRYIITKENVHEIPLFLDLLNSIAKPNEWGGSSSFVEFTGLLKFNEIADHYVDHVPRSLLDDLKERRGGINFLFSHPEEGGNPPIEQCSAWLEPYIMMPGYVVPCCAVMMSNRRPFLRKYSFGNVFKKSIKEIWQDEYYAKFRRIINDYDSPVPKVCVGCRAFRTKERVQRNGVWDIYTDEESSHQAIDEFDVTIGENQGVE